MFQNFNVTGSQFTKIHASSAIFKTRILRMRTPIRRMRRTWRTRRIRRTQRIWRIRRIQRTRRIFKSFLSFIYSTTKGFTSFSKLSSEFLGYTWLKSEQQISRKERYSQVLTVRSTWWLCFLVFSVFVLHYILYIYHYYIYVELLYRYSGIVQRFC